MPRKTQFIDEEKSNLSAIDSGANTRTRPRQCRIAAEKGGWEGPAPLVIERKTSAPPCPRTVVRNDPSEWYQAYL